ncbi:hypothetical protein Tco_0272912 [Tanacetum coccineum]
MAAMVSRGFRAVGQLIGTPLHIKVGKHSNSPEKIHDLKVQGTEEQTVTGMTGSAGWERSTQGRPARGWIFSKPYEWLASVAEGRVKRCCVTGWGRVEGWGVVDVGRERRPKFQGWEGRERGGGVWVGGVQRTGRSKAYGGWTGPLVILTLRGSPYPDWYRKALVGEFCIGGCSTPTYRCALAAVGLVGDCWLDGPYAGCYS